MDDSILRDEVLALALACRDHDATDEERARLERLLADHAQAVDCYLHVMADSLTLRDAVAANQTSEKITNNPSSAACELERQSAVLSLRPPAGRARRTVLWAAAACVLVVVAGWLWSSMRTTPQFAERSTDEQSARVVNLVNVRWSAGAPRFAEWSFVRPGDQLKFDAGLISLYLPSGVDLLIEGPADLDVVSLERLMARQGKLAARVGPGATGFRIDTPHAKVIDRGTSFGLTVDSESRTDVAVYDGAVDLGIASQQDRPLHRLVKGEALRVDRQGQLSRITLVESTDFLELRRVQGSAAPRERVIAAVHDNVRSLATAKYYRIVPGGFQEDCRAYVDRLHEWNGVDERGLPPFLVGGDYVMTFNDDKIVTEIEIAVVLNQPAVLYILIDERVPPPDWLTKDFVNTNWQVGADESHPHRDLFTDIGAGRSIDQVFSVWKREVPEAATVVLGALSSEESAMPARSVERSMYGIVAMPLHRKSAVEPQS